MNSTADYFPQFGTGTWWVEITTFKPPCTYYFGPFYSYREAELHSPGYIEDLVKEGTGEMLSLIKCCNPTELTVSLEETNQTVPV
ncbi:DUF1816 domain-containing protein [Pseudanabaena sp. FACHB-2040]|uniref:DUF1816 domain-containing protein n=1 Tax=Pseudanabaena sp. FACHB-2040 TaxID=2692859 RepID=UPI001682A1B4|nr:DUF1816 domain-containing protein [Pseudanabaena sp. FACHB-2040]MBD2256445.1 DUF1816 domain-containing protein [Pseudanabaena sp. FACHB-2040]